MGKTKRAMLWGSALVLAGWVIIFLMATNLIAKSLFLSFFAYGIFLVGFTMGMVAAFTHAQVERRLREGQSLEGQQFYDEDP